MTRFQGGRRNLPFTGEWRGWVALFLVPIGAFFATMANASMIPAQKTASDKVSIRVRLLAGVPEIRVRGLDLKIQQAGSDALVKADLSSEWMFRCGRGGVYVYQLSGKTERIRAHISGTGARVHTPAGFLHVNGKPYREEIRIYASRSGCEVVNHLDLEKYLDGLVNAEFSAKWNEEAIAAQVVAARTYALYQMGQFRTRHYDVESDVSDQVYDGVANEDFRASRAVRKSRGWVLTVRSPKEFKLLKAFYHSTCGGSTELPQKVWGKPHAGFRRPVTCRFCQASPKFRWQVTLGSPEILAALSRAVRTQGLPPGWPSDALTWLNDGKLIGLSAGRLSDAGRVEQIQMFFSRGNKTLRLVLPGARFRSWVGSGQIQSAAFRAVAVEGTRDLKWVFEGRGYGHGVGMCQWGAKVMGDKGYTMAQILRYYYPDAILRRM